VPKLSIVIPATDAPAHLDRVVAAIRDATLGDDEIIVIEEPWGLGPAAARNAGAKRAVGDVLVFVDADVVVARNALARIRAAFDADPELAAIFGSYDDDPPDGGLVSDFRNLLHHFVHHEAAGRAATFWAGLGAVRADVFRSAGGFDEERFPHPAVEDIEFGMRLSKRGARVLLDPAIQGKHLKRWTLVSMVKTDLLRRALPWLELVLERRGDSSALNLAPRHRVATVAAVSLVAGLVRRDVRIVAGAAAVILVNDRKFYVLMRRRRGTAFAVAAFPVHLVHRLTSAAAVPIALFQHVRRHK
jgi:glycosyltransferase involved in cell wall biosynthesis